MADTVDDGWFHAIGVMVVGNEVEASNYVGMVVRFGVNTNMQIRSNRPHVFRIKRRGYARLALMDGNFVRHTFIDVGQVNVGSSVEVLS